MALTLRQWRMVKDISQQKLADAIGVHVNTYTNWESGKSKMPIDKALLVCKELGVCVDDVIFFPKVST